MNLNEEINAIIQMSDDERESHLKWENFQYLMWLIHIYCKALQELLPLSQRDEAKKPIRLDGYDTCMCRGCSGYIEDGAFCRHCGQKLDWTDDETRF